MQNILCIKRIAVFRPEICSKLNLMSRGISEFFVSNQPGFRMRRKIAAFIFLRFCVIPMQLLAIHVMCSQLLANARAFQGIYSNFSWPLLLSEYVVWTLVIPKAWIILCIFFLCQHFPTCGERQQPIRKIQ